MFSSRSRFASLGIRLAAAAVFLLPAGAQPRLTSQSGPNLPVQLLGPNDLISISVYDAPELSHTMRIAPEGWIRLPMMKERVNAAGKLPAQVEADIAAGLRREQILVEPLVSVTVMEYFSRPVAVSGAVRNPTTVQAIGQLKLLDAIARAGGLSPDAGPEIIVTVPARAGEAAAPLRISVKRLIDAADPEANILLHGGEEVRVPEAARVYVIGNVRRPGSFFLRDSSETTVLKVLAMAEGLAPYSAKEAYILRQTPAAGPRKEHAVALSNILKRKAPDVALQANDILYIPDNKSGRLSATILERLATLTGATASGVLIWRR